MMPTVNRRRGRSRASSANTPATMPGRELLRRQPVAAAGHPRHDLALAVGVRLAEGGDDVEVAAARRSSRAPWCGPARRSGARVAGSASTSACAGKGRYSRTWTTPTFSPRALSAATVSATVSAPEPITTSDPLGLRVPGVVDDVERAAGALAEAGHQRPRPRRDAGVERVHRLARLEVDVRVLRGAADERPLRGQRAVAMRADQLLGHERPQVVVGEHLDRVQLVRGAEAVEEVQERHPRLERRGLRDQRQVVRLLDRRRGEQRETGLPHGHHVGVVAEDRQSLRRQRPGRHVHHGTRSARRRSCTCSGSSAAGPAKR